MPSLKDELAALKIERPPERQSRPWIKWVVLLVVVAAAGAAGWQYVNRPRPIEVETAAVTQRAAGTQAAVLNASGYVTARRRATVSSKITGKVVEVNVEEGMADHAKARCSRGWTIRSPARALALAEAQAEAARRNVRENEVRLAEARLTLDRAQQLVDRQLVTAAEVDQAQAEVDSLAARDRRRRASRCASPSGRSTCERTNLDNTIIRAPFSGIAVSKDAQPGEMVSPDSAGGGFTRTGICTIVDMRSLEIEVDVNESYINRVAGRPAGHGGAQRVSRTGRSRRTSSRRCRRPIGRRRRCSCASGSTQLDPRILPDMGVKVTFLRQNAPDDAADAAAQPDDAGAEGGRPHRERPVATSSSSTRRRRRAPRGANRRRRRRSRSRSSPGCARASAWSSRRQPTLASASGPW